MKMFKVVLPNGKEHGPYKTEGAARNVASNKMKDHISRLKNGYMTRSIFEEKERLGELRARIVVYELTELETYDWPTEEMKKEKLAREAAKRIRDKQRELKRLEEELVKMQSKIKKLQVGQ